MKDRCENYDSCYFLVKMRMKFDFFFSPANKLILRPSSNSHRTRKEKGDETEALEGGGTGETRGFFLSH